MTAASGPGRSGPTGSADTPRPGRTPSRPGSRRGGVRDNGQLAAGAVEVDEEVGRQAAHPPGPGAVATGDVLAPGPQCRVQYCGGSDHRAPDPIVVGHDAVLPPVTPGDAGIPMA